MFTRKARMRANVYDAIGVDCHSRASLVVGLNVVCSELPGPSSEMPQDEAVGIIVLVLRMRQMQQVYCGTADSDPSSCCDRLAICGRAIVRKRRSSFIRLVGNGRAFYPVYQVSQQGDVLSPVLLLRSPKK
ncbi:hypothetical protein F9C07_2505 [Aspergillus flavus]|uniref:Uncharacterized protein n=1 Tax=Aspergillus flavus (strain ATCC 200026 / FGSC A1120 / IAM 13836 / NRRL 3357 / JCM 12722 / SRRC 167) TaxID=332952 RepID=A0A7U2QRV7_ASPFN|nr:hypothetical protein F9C07_2505 [Aspergillus flavus]